MRNKIVVFFFIFCLVQGLVISLPSPRRPVVSAGTVDSTVSAASAGCVSNCLYADEIDLAKLKKEEEERRKKLEKSKKQVVVITNETLKQYEKEGEKDESGEPKQAPPEAAAEGQDKKEEPKKNDPMQTREYWQNLKAEIEKNLVEMKANVEKIQSDLAGLLREELGDDLTLQKQMEIRQKRQDLEKQLEFEKTRLVNLQAQYDSLPEQARKAGVPPGWVR